MRSSYGPAPLFRAASVAQRSDPLADRALRQRRSRPNRRLRKLRPGGLISCELALQLLIQRMDDPLDRRNVRVVRLLARLAAAQPNQASRQKASEEDESRWPV